MLSGLPCKLITYNVSVVDSAGVALFCAGEERYANPNTSFLFHDLTWGRENLTADQLDLMVKSLRLSAEKMCQVITKATPLKIADVMEMFQKGATIGATKALSLGLINEVRPVCPYYLRDESPRPVLNHLFCCLTCALLVSIIIPKRRVRREVKGYPNSSGYYIRGF